MSSLFREVPDWRQSSKITISLHDALMSGMACMYFQDPSLLQFQVRLKDEQQRSNLQTLFDIKDIPKETQMRDIIDQIDSQHFAKSFSMFHSSLKKAGYFNKFELLPGVHLFPIDGTSYYSSQKIHCKHCLTKQKRARLHLELLSEVPNNVSEFKENTYVLIFENQTWHLLYIDDDGEKGDIDISTIRGLNSTLADKNLLEMSTTKNKKLIKSKLNQYHKAHAKVTTSYSHQALQGGIMHPDQKTVLPFMPEEISNSDGSTKQDCEMNAAKRLIDRLCKEYPDLSFIVNGDSLFSKQPIIEHILSKKMHFLFSAKLTDHIYLKQWLAIDPKLSKKRHTDKQGNIHYYEWMNNVPLNARKDRISINFIRYKMFNPAKNKITYQNHWVTDLDITKDNIATLVKGGRCRWKAENECFNVLKNHGYSLEHNYGHGKDNLCFNFYLMTLLAFFMHQTFELDDPTYQAAREKFGSKKHMWETLRSYIKIIVFDTWEDLLEFSLTPKRYTLIQEQPP